MSRKKRKSRLPPFIPVIRSTAATPAWKAMSMGARWLYVILASYVSTDGKNNGSVYRSYRDACSDLGTRSKTSIGRWFQEIEYYGFAVKTYEGALGSDGYGEAPHWRLTEYPTLDARGYHAAPTRDFERWNGVRFVPRKTESRTHGRDTLSPPVGHRELAPEAPRCTHGRDICSGTEVSPPVEHILVATPLSSLKVCEGSVGPSVSDQRPTAAPPKAALATVPHWVFGRRPYPIAQPTQPYTGYSSLPIELRMLALGLPISGAA